MQDTASMLLSFLTHRMSRSDYISMHDRNHHEAFSGLSKAKGALMGSPSSVM